MGWQMQIIITFKIITIKEKTILGDIASTEYIS